MGRGHSPADLSRQRCWFQSFIKRVSGMYTSNVYAIRMSNVSVVFFRVQTCYSIDNQGNWLTAKCMAFHRHLQSRKSPHLHWIQVNVILKVAMANPALLTTTLARGESFKNNNLGKNVTLFAFEQAHTSPRPQHTDTDWFVIWPMSRRGRG